VAEEDLKKKTKTMVSC